MTKHSKLGMGTSQSGSSETPFFSCVKRLSKKLRGWKQEVQSEAVATAQRTGGAGRAAASGALRSQKNPLCGRVCGKRERDTQSRLAPGRMGAPDPEEGVQE